MTAIIPILIVLAGVVLLFSRRRHTAIKATESPRVIVKGHTYSEIIEDKATTAQEIHNSRIEHVRRCCIIGAGRVGAITGIVLAMHNPGIEFFVVDGDERLIEAWKSSNLPICAPVLEEIFFDDACIQLDGEKDAATKQHTSETKIVGGQRRRKLSNLTFSADVYAGVTAADLIFLCLEMDAGLTDDSKPTLSSLESTLQTIAHASKGHKIIVQRTTAPYGTAQSIKNRLRSISSPTASFTLLTNPDFTLPGTTLQDTLNPTRVIIGHIYAADTSEKSIAALKGLYTSWIPEDRIITMDAWSAELGRLASKALMAQQVASLNCICMVSEGTEASTGRVGWMVGFPDPGTRSGMGCEMSEVRCLMYLARELGMHEVAEYWRSVIRMEEYRYKKLAREVVERLEGGLTKRKVAFLGVIENREMAVVLMREIRRVGVGVYVFDRGASKKLVESVLGVADISLDGIQVAESLESACSGCSAVVLYGPCMTGYEWQTIVGQMEEPKVVLDVGGCVDRVKMQQWGCQVL